MPVFDGKKVRLTPYEHGKLHTQARRNGRLDAMPTHIRDTETLEEARLQATGGCFLQQLEQFIAEGTSEASRGELSQQEIFGEQSAV